MIIEKTTFTLSLCLPEGVIDRAHRIGPDYTEKKKHRKCVTLSLFDLQRSVIVQHFTELEGLYETGHRLD